MNQLLITALTTAFGSFSAPSMAADASYASMGIPAAVHSVIHEQFKEASLLCAEAGGQVVNRVVPHIVGFTTECSSSRHGAFTLSIRADKDDFRLSAQFDAGWREAFHAGVAELLSYQGQAPSMSVTEGPTSVVLTAKIRR